MKVMVILTVFGGHGMVFKGLDKVLEELENRNRQVHSIRIR